MPRASVAGLLDRLRAICLALPEATEKQTWDIPTFRVGDKIFAMAHDPGTVWCKAPRGVQAILVEAAPARFFVPPYVGHKGWIGFQLDHTTDWDEVAALVCRSYRMTAPKRLAAQVPAEDQESERHKPRRPASAFSPD
jgi:hypothetical protein